MDVVPLTCTVRNFSIAIGPVLGGLLANFLGFRWDARNDPISVYETNH